jgi:hypothetical protein
MMKTVTVEVTDGTGVKYKAILEIEAEQWMDNADVGLEILEAARRHGEGLTFKEWMDNITLKERK